MEKLNKQRGLRNCNPLNIRRTADLWQGLAERQPDPEFFTFRSMPWGYRAAFIVLRTYCHKYGLRTVRDIIARWAPPEDGNDTGNYIRKVCVLTGFPPDKCLNPYDPSHMAPLVAAMSRVECGVKPIMSQIKEGWSLYMGYGLPFSNLTFKTSMPMNKTVWNTLLNVIIAVASAILGAIGGSAM